MPVEDAEPNLAEAELTLGITPGPVNGSPRARVEGWRVGGLRGSRRISANAVRYCLVPATCSIFVTTRASVL